MRARPYLMVARNSLMANMAYRGHFYFMLVGTIASLVVGRFLYGAIYESGGSLGGLRLEEAFLYVGLSLSLSGFMRTGTEWYVANIVSSGDIVSTLAKPMDFAAQLFFDSLGGAAMSLVAITIPALAATAFLAHAAFPPIWRLLLFIPSVVLAFLLYFLIDFMTGLSVFLTQSIGGVSIAKDTIVMALSGAIVPLAFFPQGAKAVLEWLPFQALYNAPVSLIALGSLGPSEALLILARQALWLLAFFALSRLLFRAALKKLVVNGG